MTAFVDSCQQAIQDSVLNSFDYTPETFREYFTSPFEQYRDKIGKKFTVVKRLPDAEAVDGGVGEDMYLIRFGDGEEIEVFGHEVCLLNYDRCS